MSADFIGSELCQIGQHFWPPTFLGRMEHVLFFSADVGNATLSLIERFVDIIGR